jgi:TPP-dependent trihydroxycyclohexane-1,2-dione (THcHDO) dehydratase
MLTGITGTIVGSFPSICPEARDGAVKAAKLACAIVIVGARMTAADTTPDRTRSGVPGFEIWWDVPGAELSDDPRVRKARSGYDHDRGAQRQYLEQA